MKPSDLRRDAYTWQAIANSAKDRATTAGERGYLTLSARLHTASRALQDAVEGMATLADELEARNAS